MPVTEDRRSTTREQVELAFGRLAAARRSARNLDPSSAEAPIMNAGLDVLTKLLWGVKMLVESAEGVAQPAEREHLSRMPNECCLEIS